MQAPWQGTLVTDETTIFTEALAPGAASAMYNVPMQWALGRSQTFMGVTVTQKELFAAEFNLFLSSTGFASGNDPQASKWIGYWGFSEAMYVQIPGSTLYQASIYGIALPYYDLDTVNTQNPPTFHVKLVNRSAANSKSAGAAGYVSATFFVAPIGATNL